jgi:hypothetical protein
MPILCFDKRDLIKLFRAVNKDLKVLCKPTYAIEDYTHDDLYTTLDMCVYMFRQGVEDVFNKKFPGNKRTFKQLLAQLKDYGVKNDKPFYKTLLPKVPLPVSDSYVSQVIREKITEIHTLFLGVNDTPFVCTTRVEAKTSLFSELLAAILTSHSKDNLSVVNATYFWNRCTFLQDKAACTAASLPLATGTIHEQTRVDFERDCELAERYSGSCKDAMESLVHTRYGAALILDGEVRDEVIDHLKTAIYNFERGSIPPEHVEDVCKYAFLTRKEVLEHLLESGCGMQDTKT